MNSKRGYIPKWCCAKLPALLNSQNTRKKVKIWNYFWIYFPRSRAVLAPNARRILSAKAGRRSDWNSFRSFRLTCFTLMTSRVASSGRGSRDQASVLDKFNVKSVQCVKRKYSYSTVRLSGEVKFSRPVWSFGCIINLILHGRVTTHRRRKEFCSVYYDNLLEHAERMVTQNWPQKYPNKIIREVLPCGIYWDDNTTLWAQLTGVFLLRTGCLASQRKCGR